MLDILAFTETSENADTGFFDKCWKSQVMKNFIQLPKHQKVELLFMVNKNYVTIERNDLNINNAEFESTMELMIKN